MKDERIFKALWLSYSSITDFLKCPRAYYLKNIYKEPETNRKIQLITPHLALGQVVHEVLESLSVLPVADRLNVNLLQNFNNAWKKVEGKKGGFFSLEEEIEFKKRGENMIRRVLKNPGPIAEKAVKINMDLPYFWLDEAREIILCGKIDWLRYKEEDDSVEIIDFKTSKTAFEDEDSLQLPIYALLVHFTQHRRVSGVSYWYLERDDIPTPKPLPNIDESLLKIKRIAQKIKVAKKLDSFKCPHGDKGCVYCRPYEKIINGEAEFVGVDQHGRRSVYVIPKERQIKDDLTDNSYIL